MPGRIPIGLLALFLLLALGLASVTGQPSDRPSGQPTSPISSGDKEEKEKEEKGEKGGGPRSNPASESVPVGAVPAGSVPGRTAGSKAGSPQDQFRTWLANSSEGRWYAGISSHIEDIAQKIDGAGIPMEVIRIRMREAQAKKVAAEVFAEALATDASHWARVSALLGDERWPPASKAPDFYIAASNALRNGVNEAAISALITWALESRGTPERAGAVLMSVSSLTEILDPAGTGRAVALIGASRLRVGEFDDLVALLKRASAAGLASTDLIAAMDTVLGNRGTLRSLERRLFP